MKSFLRFCTQKPLKIFLLQKMTDIGDESSLDELPFTCKSSSNYTLNESDNEGSNSHLKFPSPVNHWKEKFHGYVWSFLMKSHFTCLEGLNLINADDDVSSRESYKRKTRKSLIMFTEIWSQFHSNNILNYSRFGFKLQP